jgi:uncharacterized protein YjbI with pentapeptide repeats
VEAAVKAGASLVGASLVGARLDGANLDGANLAGANLDGATGISGFYSFGPGGSRNAYTWARWEAGKYMVHCGCQTLELSAFRKAVIEKHGKTYHAKWYLAHVAVMKLVAAESKAAHLKEAKP